MRLKKIIPCILLSLIFFFSACTKDNYAAPDSGVYGTITNALTNVGIQTEQPNGVKIRLLEVKYGAGSATALDFWGKPDGSFANAVVFSGKYKIVPIEGAFFPADTALIDVQGQTQVNFKVTPFLNVSANVVATAGGISASYKLSRDRVGDKIFEARLLVSEYPSVGFTINEEMVIRDLSLTDDATVLATQYTDAVTKLVSGKTYYARVAARTNNPLKKYNYSEVVKITIP